MSQSSSPTMGAFAELTTKPTSATLEKESPIILPATVKKSEEEREEMSRSKSSSEHNESDSARPIISDPLPFPKDTKAITNEALPIHLRPFGMDKGREPETGKLYRLKDNNKAVDMETSKTYRYKMR